MGKERHHRGRRLGVAAVVFRPLAAPTTTRRWPFGPTPAGATLGAPIFVDDGVIIIGNVENGRGGRRFEGKTRSAFGAA